MKAILLLAFGGPRSPEEVEPFLTRLFRGRKPPPEVLERVKERYRLIGGGSPLLEITRTQARALEEKLNERGYPFKSYVGMRYGHPLIEETMERMVEEGVREAIAVPMTPFRSSLSTGAYKKEAERALENMGERIKLSFAEGWHIHPLFLEAIAGRIEEGLGQFDPEERRGVHLIFTSHSLPKSTVEKDPYVGDMEETVKGVLNKIGIFPWHIAFQSKGSGTEEWLGPDVESVLKEISSQSIHGVLIVPVGFVADHVEVLYDIDILYREEAESLGIVLRRTSSLNSSERFIEALASIVEEHMEGLNGSGGRGPR